jgi:gingipain R
MLLDDERKEVMVQRPHANRLQIALAVTLLGLACHAHALDSWHELAGGRPGDEPRVTIRQVTATVAEVAIAVPGLHLATVAQGGEVHSAVVVPGCVPMLAEGHPELPILARAVALPAEGTPRIEIVAAEWQRLRAPPPLPSRGPISRSGDRFRSDPVKADVYRQAGPWPVAAAELGDPFLVRDRRGAALRVFPVRWDPATGEFAALVHLTLRIETTGQGGLNPLRPGVASAERTFGPIHRAIFTEDQLVSQAKLADPAAQSGSDNPDGPERLLIVTAAVLQPVVDDLAAWKRELGFAVEMLDIATLGGHAQGIKAAVERRYHEPAGLAHLLLVGDVDLVPTNAGDHEGAAADGVYGLVAGDDLFVDVLVSRLPARNRTELATMVRRTVAYERDPRLDADWYTSALGIASDEGHPADYDRAEWLRSMLLSGSYTDIGRIYQGFGAAGDQITAAVTAGTSLINYIGHANVDGWLSVPFRTADVHRLTNTAAWPWIIDVSCSTGDFRQPECFAEAWLRASHEGEPTGAVAVLAASTDASWVPPTVMQAAIVDHLTRTGESEVGALVATGVAAVLVQYGGTGEDRKLMEQYNLFGDGSLRVRSRRPESLLVAHPPRLPVGADGLQIDVSAAARATLTTGGELLAMVDLDAAGAVHLAPSRPLLAGETVRLTVSAPNTRPYRVELIVGDGAAAPTEAVPAAVALLGNWPNPFNPQTTVGLALPVASPVTLTVHDVRGRLVRVLVDGHLPAGNHHLDWDGLDASGRPAPSGTYLARLVAGGGEQTHKLMLAR